MSGKILFILVNVYKGFRLSFVSRLLLRYRLIPSRYLSVFWDERRLGIRLRCARGLMGREEGKIATFRPRTTGLHQAIVSIY